MAVTLQCGFTLNSQNLDANTSNITAWVNTISNDGSWNHLDSYGSITFGGNASGTFQFDAWFDANVTTRIYTRTFDVAHNADGSAYVSLSCAFNTNVSSGTIYGSAEMTLPPIPRASTVSASGTFELGQPITIKINRSSQKFVHTLKYAWGNRSSTIASGVSTQYVWTPPVSLAQYLTNNTQADCIITCETRNSDSDIVVGTTTTVINLKIPTSVKPTISNTVFSDTSGFIGTYDAFVQNQSNIRATVTASSMYGATMARYDVSVSNLGSFGGTSNVVDIGRIGTSGTLTVTVTAKDSRGRTDTKTYQIVVSPYNLPTLGGTKAYRWDADTGEETDESTTIRIDVDIKTTDINSKGVNNSQVRVYGKLSTATEYTSITTQNQPPGFSEFSAYVYEVSETVKYDIRVVAEDKLGNSVTWETTINTATPMLDFKADGKGVAMFGISNVDGLKLNGDFTLGYENDIYYEKEDGTRDYLLEIDVGGVLDRTRYAKNLALANSRFLQAVTSAGNYTNLLGLDAMDVTRFFWTRGGLRGRCRSPLFSGQWAVGANINMSELPYYNMLIVFPSSQTRCPIIMNRTTPSNDNTGSATFFGIGGMSSSGVIRVFSGQISVSSGTSATLTNFGYFLNNNTTFVSDSVSRVEGVL